MSLQAPVRLAAKRGGVRLVGVERGQLLARKVGAELQFGEGALRFQILLLGRDTLVAKDLLALEERLLKLQVGECGEVLALDLGNLTAFEDGNDFALFHSVAEALSKFGDGAGHLGGDPGNLLGVGCDRAGHDEASRELAARDLCEGDLDGLDLLGRELDRAFRALFFLLVMPTSTVAVTIRSGSLLPVPRGLCSC